MEGGELSIACARWEPSGFEAAELDAIQARIARAVVASGAAWFGTVHAQGRSWLRFTLVSTFTREEHLGTLVERLVEAAGSSTS